MKKSIILLIFIALALFEAGFLYYFNIFGALPNLLLLCLVITTIDFSLPWAIAFAIFLGLLKDTFQLGSLAINTLLFPFWSFLIQQLSRKISFENIILPALLVFILLILHNVTSRLIFISLGQDVVSLGLFLRLTILSAFYTAALTPLVSKLIKSGTS
jgi:rod shape-determining protein MreD